MLHKGHKAMLYGLYYIVYIKLSDFFGLNHYGSDIVKYDENQPYKHTAHRCDEWPTTVRDSRTNAYDNSDQSDHQTMMTVRFLVTLKRIILVISSPLGI